MACELCTTTTHKPSVVTRLVLNISGIWWRQINGDRWYLLRTRFLAWPEDTPDRSSNHRTRCLSVHLFTQSPSFSSGYGWSLNRTVWNSNSVLKRHYGPFARAKQNQNKTLFHCILSIVTFMVTSSCLYIFSIK